jgi:lipid-binding SYLF domain-containing protein
MLSFINRHFCAVLLLVSLVTFGVAVQAESKTALEQSSRQALSALVKENPSADALNDKAIAVLVFPKVTKAGLIVGGQYGEGVLWRDGKAAGFYNTAGASVGFQAGAQEFGYALFFMKDSALKALDTAQGFEVGVGPSIVVMDKGMAVSRTTTTLQNDIYAFIFDQRGLMAGLGIQGNKITKIDK